MEFLGVIPARGGSKGIVKKNLRLLKGKPLIAWTIEAAKKSNVSRVIVSTDCEEIAKTAQFYGAEVPFIRPKHLARDDTPIEPVLKHAAHFLCVEERYKPDALVLLQSTHPLRKSYEINVCLDEFKNNECDSVVSVSQAIANDNPDWMLKKNSDGLVTLFNGLPLTQIPDRRQDLQEVFKRNDVAYVLKLDNLNTIKPNLYGSKVHLVEVGGEIEIDLNTEMDWKILESIFHLQV